MFGIDPRGLEPVDHPGLPVLPMEDFAAPRTGKDRAAASEARRQAYWAEVEAAMCPIANAGEPEPYDGPDDDDTEDDGGCQCKGKKGVANAGEERVPNYSGAGLTDLSPLFAAGRDDTADDLPILPLPEVGWEKEEVRNRRRKAD